MLGMRGNGDWVTDQRPKNWRQQILKLYPNGQAPLTAMLSMMRSSAVDDPEFYWWTKTFAAAGGAVAGVYTLPDLSVAYVTGAVDGTVLYLSVTELVAANVRAGHTILMRDASDYTVDVVGKVIGVTHGAVNSVIAVKLLEADDNSSLGDLSNCDTFKVIGNSNPEGGEMPDAISTDPTKVYNKTQIFRTPLSITRTARKTKLRTGDQYQQMKAEALEMHSIEMEMAFLWGIMTEKTGDNGKPERTTRGIINFIRTYAPANVDDYTQNATYHGKAWTADGGGQTWLKNALELLFRYGAEEKMCFCGSGALLGIDALAETFGTIQIVPGQKTYGMQIREWVTPFGSIYLKTHPLFSYDATTRNMMLIIEPKELEYRYIDDTSFYGENSNKTSPEGHGGRRLDGTNEEYLTECGLEFGLAQKCGLLNGVGLDH
jgi:hypothetical protein